MAQTVFSKVAGALPLKGSLSTVHFPRASFSFATCFQTVVVSLKPITTTNHLLIATCSSDSLSSCQVCSGTCFTTSPNPSSEIGSSARFPAAVRNLSKPLFHTGFKRRFASLCTGKFCFQKIPSPKFFAHTLSSQIGLGAKDGNDINDI